ncbi:phage head-tail adapter protein [Enterococcus faecalis]|nr:phage head-tail adapter protein [Enterococcus faecalis]MDT2226295.1 phage head-tail adapter protein [Enterococcus faecalis]
MRRCLMMIHPSYKKPKINSGNLRTPVQFWRFVPNDGPEPMEEKREKLYECFCLAYNPSMKDMEILNAKGTNEGLTIKIRDPHQDYIPTNKHKVIIDDYRVLPKGKEWEIVDVSTDFEDNRFIKIVLGATS